MKDIGHRIRLLRVERNLKQYELAEMVARNGHSLTASYLCRIEQGQKGPTIKVAVAIAQALGVSLDDIVSTEPELA